MPVIAHSMDVPGLPPASRYAYAVTVTGRLAFLAGQVASDAADQVVGPGDIAAQTEQALVNLYAVIRSLGAGWSDVVRFNWYLLDATQVQTVRDVRDRVMGPNAGPPPASTLVQVGALAGPEWLIEVDAVVALPE
jgi:enamine deaminase RidA (YjgF/YER057c/UK114 family)